METIDTHSWRPDDVNLLQAEVDLLLLDLVVVLLVHAGLDLLVEHDALLLLVLLSLTLTSAGVEFVVKVLVGQRPGLRHALVDVGIVLFVWVQLAWT